MPVNLQHCQITVLRAVTFRQKVWHRDQLVLVLLDLDHFLFNSCGRWCDDCCSSSRAYAEILQKASSTVIHKSSPVRVHRDTSVLDP